MIDVVDKATRSRMMSGIRSKNTKGELQLRRELHALGFRYRLHSAKLPGKPDLVFSKHRAVVFVNGCFWHGHGCSLFKWPKTRQDFWTAKINGNRERDQRVQAEIIVLGWRVGVVWECSWKGKYKLDDDDRLQSCVRWLESTQSRLELFERHDVTAGPPD